MAGHDKLANAMNQIDELAYIPPERETRRLQQIKTDIEKAFSLFERDNSRTCDVTEMGTIVRALGLNPTEAQIIAMVEEIEETPPTGYVHYAKFAALMKQILLTGEFRGAMMARPSEAAVLQAFEMLDPHGTGYLDGEMMRELLTTAGEKFGPDEVSEFLNAACDPETGQIHYDDYVALLADL
eukprot:GGOE01013925.1.p1 GENE.GGOE01013925.1~~GGOE01013925.1.p1  ORF type:complete len:183 (+),score=54.99 GGOE01013925.1:77-625(+)